MLSHQRRFFYRVAILFSLSLSLASLGLLGGFTPSVSRAATTSGPLYAWGSNSNGKLGNGSTNNSSTPVSIILASGVTASAVAGGSEFSLAIGSDNKLYSWGYNADGELGNGTTNTGPTTPAAVTLATGVTPTAISAGASHSLAIGSDNKLYAWGNNIYGRLGDNSTTNRLSPVVVTLATGVTPTAVKAGNDHSLAIGSDNKLYAWGNNASGQLGDGSTTLSLTPKVITLATGVTPTAIAAAQGWSMAIGSDNKLYVWGNNAFGQLGDGTTSQSLLPKAITLATSVTPTQVAATGFHAMAIGSNGKLYTWGNNTNGQLGNGSTTNSSSPAAITLATGVTPTKIVSGFFHSMAIGSDNKLYAWGYNANGQLGDGTTTNRTTPTAIALTGGVTPFVIGAGYQHSFVIVSLPTLSITNVTRAEGNSGTTNFIFTVTLSTALTQSVSVNYATSDGTATAGSDYTATSSSLLLLPGATSGTITVPVLGDTTLEPNETFLVKLSNPSSGVNLAVSQGVGTIVNDDGGLVYGWGANQTGLLGNGTTNGSLTPTVAFLPTTMTALASGSEHTLAIGSDGKLYSWGRNDNGQLGNGTNTNSTSPVVVTLASGVSPVAIAASYYSSYAIGSDGKLYAWGRNTEGQLGNGTNIDRSTPGLVSLPAGVTPTAIASGVGFAMAISSDGNLYAWGVNDFGQVGDGTITARYTPVTVTLPTSVSPTAIAAGSYHALMFGSDGNLYSWGRNSYGELGIGNTTNTYIPTKVTLASGVTPVRLAGGDHHSLAIGSDGKVYTWGLNDQGQLGNNTTTNSSTPVAVTLATGVNAVGLGAGWSHSLAIGSNGKLYTWGLNDYGQLGNNTTTNSLTPIVASLAAGATPFVVTGAASGSLVLIPTPSLSIGNVSHLEGNSGNTSFSFPVTLTYASAQTITLSYATSDGTATAGTDYTAATGTLTFAPGLSSTTIAVSAKGDTTVEPNETFFVNLSNVTNATVASSQGIGTIFNDDTTASGPLYSWGSNQYGQLGDTTTTDKLSPVFTYLPKGVVATRLASGSNHNLAIGSDGKLYAWGLNTFGQLGDGTTTTRTTPVAITLASGVTPVAIATGYDFSLAIGSDNKLYGWGNNNYGQLADGTTTPHSTPATITLASGVTPIAIAAGYSDSLAVGSDGNLYGSGYNLRGQLCDSTTTSKTSPTTAKLPGGVVPVAIAAGGYHTLIIGSDNQLYTCGYNLYGQLGNGATTDKATPQLITLASGVTPIAVAGGFYHSLAIGSDGKFYSWGDNEAGQLGDGSLTNKSTPQGLTLASGVTPTAIAAPNSGLQSLAIGSDGKFYDWGANGSGQLGNGTATQRTSPAATSLPGGVTPGAIAAGSLHSLAILPAPSLNIGSVSQAEGNSGTTSFSFPVTLTYTSSQTVTVNYATSNGTATAGSDYTATTGTLTFVPGMTTLTVTVAVLGDTVVEPDETFTVTLSSPSGATLATSQGTGTILNDDTPTFSINNVSQAEGNSGTTSFTFTVTLSAASYQTVTVSYATSDGTARAGSDYTATSGTLTFAPGTTTKTISVAVTGDTTYETDETFFVTLSNPSGATLATSQGTGTILNDDSTAISINNVSQAEGDSGTTNFIFTVTLSAASSQTVTVLYATSDNTATGGSDYTATSGTLTFSPGTTAQTVTVPVIGDTVVEPDETFKVTLSNPSGATLATSQGTGTILNDDTPTLSINNVSQAEGDSGTTNFTFTVTLSAASSQNVTVLYGSSDDTATAGSDYTATTGTLTFAPGTTSGTITVPVLGDTVAEPDETFFVTLSNPTGATLATAQGTGTILNDDSTAISIGDVSQAEGNSGTTSFSFPVTLSAASSQTITVDYATSDGTATAGSDYTATTGTLTFTPGTITQNITVAVNGDSSSELDETFFVTLSNPDGAVLATSQGTGTILNDDNATISIGNVSRAEGNSGTTNFSFPVTLSVSSSQTVTVNYATSDGTATAGSDYSATSGTLTFTPGTTTMTITVAVIGDTAIEPDENLFVTLSNPSGATLATSQGTGTILNDDATAFSISNVLQVEGNSGTTNFTFSVTLSPAYTQTVTVNYATSDLTAKAGSDYTATSGTLTFAPGTATQTISVAVNGDTTLEPNETFLVKLSNPTSGIKLAVSQGVGTIVNDEGGVVYSSGNNQYGQFGNGGANDSLTPTPAVLPVAMTTIASGDYHTLGIGTDGNLYTWGYNKNGQLGDGTTNDQYSPELIMLASGVRPVAIAASYDVSFAIGSDGNLYGWGWNVFGQLGDGTTNNHYTPEVITLASGVRPTAIVGAYYHTLVIGSDGNLYAWGSNHYGQVGNGTNADRNSPVVVTLADGVTPRAIAAGGYHSLAIGSDDKLYAWGDATYGALGNGTTSSGSLTPIAVTLASGVTPTQIWAGIYHSLAVGSDGKFYTWGYNSFGQLCNGTSANSSTPAAVTLAGGVSAVGLAGSWESSLAIGNDGKVYQCGLSSYGQFGNGTFDTSSATPVVENLPAGASAIVAGVGHYHTTALLSTPALAIGNVSQTEGNTGTTSFSFPVTLTYASSQTVTVNYATSNGTATAGSDYTSTSGTLSFAPGTITRTITVAVNGDTVVEPDETFFVTLSNPNGATLATAQGTGTILNDDNQGTTLSLTSSPNPAAVGQSVTFTATVSPATATGTLTFTFDSVNSVTAPLNASGVATYVTSTLSLGQHTVVATYTSATGSASATLTQTITSGAASGLVLVSGDTQQTVISTAFGKPLVAKVTDGSGNAVSGVQVSFTAPASGASARFGGSAVYTGTTDSSGLVTTTIPTANNTVGSYTVSAAIVPGANPARALRGGSGPRVTTVQYHLTNLASAPATISAVSGGGQSASINTAFGNPLVARVVDSGANPVGGVSVTFTAPGSGASGSFAGGSATYTGTTDTNGLITATVFTANGTAGSYSVTATVNGIASPASFTLTNLSGCNPFLVTSALDDGSCGTLRQALAFASSSPTKTITINLTAGSVISLTTGLTLTSGVSITTTATCGSGANNTMIPPITLQGVGASSGNGLTLAGSNSLYGLWVRGFSGLQIHAPTGSSTKMVCVKASKL